MKLTVKQEAFAKAYVETGNASEAAQDCGLSLGRKPPAHGAYVYLLLCHEQKRILYVGKGRGNRMHQHLREARAGRISGVKKFKAITEVLRLGQTINPVVFASDLSDRDALRLERMLIAKIGRDRLANSSAGERDPDDIILAGVEHSLYRIKPFAEWVRERPRTPGDIDLYGLVLSELQRMRDNPQARIRVLEARCG